MIRKIFAAVFLTAILFFAQNVSAEPSVNYRVYIQDYGWMRYVRDGQVAGTTGEGLRMEAIVIDFDGIEYNPHVQDYGWRGWVPSGVIAGTTGESRRMEAIRIRLTGGYANRYDVYYRAHVQEIGWTNWVRNGEVAGTVGEGLRMEAIQIRIDRKGSRYYDDDNDYDAGDEDDFVDEGAYYEGDGEDETDTDAPDED